MKVKEARIPTLLSCKFMSYSPEPIFPAGPESSPMSTSYFTEHQPHHSTLRFSVELHASACLASVPSGFAREKDLLLPFVKDDGLGGERTEPTCLFKRITTLRGIVSVRRVRPSQYHVCVQELTIRAPY